MHFQTGQDLAWPHSGLSGSVLRPWPWPTLETLAGMHFRCLRKADVQPLSVSKLDMACIMLDGAQVAGMRSNLWPGAAAVASGSAFTNVYVGWGIKTAPFLPLPPPPVAQEYDQVQHTQYTHMYLAHLLHPHCRFCVSFVPHSRTWIVFS